MCVINVAQAVANGKITAVESKKKITELPQALQVQQQAHISTHSRVRTSKKAPTLPIRHITLPPTEQAYITKLKGWAIPKIQTTDQKLSNSKELKVSMSLVGTHKEHSQRARQQKQPLNTSSPSFPLFV